MILLLKVVVYADYSIRLRAIPGRGIKVKTKSKVTICTSSLCKNGQRSQTEWETDSQQLFNKGQAFIAYDLAKTGLTHFPGSIKLKQITAQSLNKAGALDEAKRILEPLCVEFTPEPDEESLGLLASVYKNIWKRTGKKDDARLSRDAYMRASLETGDYWTGINVASMSWLIGEKREATKYAKEVIKICEPVANAEKNDKDYWVLATIGEAQLLLGEQDAAIQSYAEAAKVAKLAAQRHTYIVSSLQQLKLLKKNGLPVPDKVFEILKPPTIVIFSGHMIDHHDRPVPRFPSYLELAVRNEIDRILNDLDAQIGYCSAACGSDILFIEAMLARDAEVNIVLPFDKDDFIQTSVQHAGSQWVARFHNAIEQKNRVSFVTKEKFLGDESLFDFGAEIFHGYGYIRAYLMETTPYLLAVWDKKPTKLIGGTAAIIKKWPNPDRLLVVNVEELRKEALKPEEIPKPVPSEESSVANQTENYYKRIIKTMLFADVVGYSMVQEENMHFFVNEFLPKVADELSTVKRIPKFINTWGDAIFAVMDKATEMAEYALALQSAIQNVLLIQTDLPSHLTMRIALHAGPVFEEKDPFTNRKSFYGSHVNRAARIEPVTAPGCVYASEQFVAMLTMEQMRKHHNKLSRSEFACDYVGTLSLAKDFGPQAVYQIRKKTRVELGLSDLD